MPGRDTDPNATATSGGASHAARGPHRTIIRDALRAMSIRERLVICLRYADGLSLEEIAAVLEAGTNEIERLLDQAVARIRSLVAQSAARA